LALRHFAELFSRRMKKSIETIPTETMSAMIRYDWPGNVRELQNVIERAVILSAGGTLHIPAADLEPRQSSAWHANAEMPARSPKRIRTSVPGLSRERVVAALKEAGGRVGGPFGAAARLGLKRTTLIAHMKRLGINPRTVINHF
jgi:formate hydrogenlyase transcriptional activator